jgi:TonB family protein
LILAVPVYGQYVRIGNEGAIPNEAMVAPTVIISTLPAYTDAAVVAGVDGVVTLQARVNSRGETSVLRVIRGLGYGLDETAISAVRDWVFSPALRNGVPVDVISEIDVFFNIRAANAFRVGGDVSAPGIVHRVEPQYPPGARALGVQGTVLLQALIRKDGSTEILRVVRGLQAGLTDSAVDALRQWRFKPGARGGEPVDVSVNLEVNFNLR